MAQEFDFDIGNVVGPNGDTGNGIASIELLSTSGLNKTYRITMTDETTFDFVVTDGNGITGASFDAQTNALTLTFQNGTTFTTPSLKGTKGDTGNGISKIKKTGTDGLVDTYTVTYTDGQTYTYTVTNGADGVSPEVTVTPISGGHTVEIEDADGVKTFNVLDGEVTEARMAEALATKAPVILETASGAIASFSDGADGMPIKELVANIEPVQDLHGYDNPWPAGGMGNLFPLQNKTATSNGVTAVFAGNHVRLTGTCTSSGGRLYLNTANFALKAGTYYYKRFNISDTTYPALYVQNGNMLVSPINEGTFTLSEDSTAINIGMNVVSGVTYNIEFDIMLVAGSTELSAFYPYSNICPITGHAGMNVTRTGVNVWDEEWEQGGINTSGNNTTTAGYYRSKNYIPVKPNTSYYFLMPVGMAIIYYNKDKEYLLFTSTSNSGTITTIKDAYYMRFRNLIANSWTPYSNDISINYPSTDTTYHSGTANTTIPITFPSEAGTVYGGTLDVTSGKLVVDRAMVDLGTLGYSKSSSIQSGFVATSGMPNDFPLAPNSAAIPNWICSNYGNIVSNNNIESASVDYALAWRVSAQNKGIIVKDSNYTEYYTNNDTASFKAAMSGVQLVYELTEPQTIQLTAEQVSGILETLYGTNNIWADTGSTSVTYPADTKLYIDGKIAELQATLPENIGG